MEAVAKNVLWQMDLDRKTKALKQLQGHIMREGYKNGNLKGQWVSFCIFFLLHFVLDLSVNGEVFASQIMNPKL